MRHLSRLHYGFFLHSLRNRDELHWPIFDQNTHAFLDGMVPELLKIGINRLERNQTALSEKYWQEKYIYIIRLIRLKVVDGRYPSADREFFNHAISLHAIEYLNNLFH